MHLVLRGGGEYSLAGVSATTNGMNARKYPDNTVDVVLQGTVLIVFDKDIRFDESFKMVEDYELCCKVIYRGKHTLRYNYLAANKPKNGAEQGGMHERYSNNELPFWLKRLSAKYPLFKVNKNHTGGRIIWR